MIKIYQKGNDFYLENKDFLLENKYIEVFFRFDSPLLTETNKEEYALRISKDDKNLLVLLKEPYNILLYGDKELSSDLVDFLHVNGYKIKDYLCEIDLGNSLLEAFKKYGYNYELYIGMDFMKADKKVEVDSSETEVPNENDIDEIYDLCCSFFKDCGLNDVVDKEALKNKLPDFIILRKDNKIVSMAKSHESSKEDRKISHVYTRKEYRGKGYARIVVGTVLNKIIDSGYYATLNVDQANPISYHLYSSLGFKKVFSQGIFVLKK